MLLSFALAAAGALASRRPAAAASPSRRAASLSKGPRRVTLPSPGNPLVAIRLLFQVGAADDPTGKGGLADLTAAMLGSAGTQRRSWAEVLDALYPMAGRFRAVRREIDPEGKFLNPHLAELFS